MKRSITPWTTAVAAAALLVLPAAGSAQTTTPQQPPTGTTDTTAAQAASQGQADAQAARRHLTDARDTLSELTQLPQAAQLSGDARAQVTQLIANFNELITTDDNWRASYAKVEANLAALLGPDTMTAAAATGTTGTGTTGTVGTTGAAPAEALDPEVREKLMKMRTTLKEFERAAGGAAQPGAIDPSAPSATDPTAATSTTTDPQNPQPQTHAAPAAHMDQAEMIRHIEAIEAILNANDPMAPTAAAAAPTTGTTGTAGTTGTTSATPPAPGTTAGEAVTLTRAQVEQLRLHLNQLRGLVQK